MVRHDYPTLTNIVPDRLCDKAVARFNRRYYWWVALGLALPALVGGFASVSLAGALTGFWAELFGCSSSSTRCRRSIPFAT